MRVIFRFVARLLGATLVTAVVLISLTATAAAARTVDQAPAPRLQPVVDTQTTPWTVVAWLAAGLVLVAAAGAALTVVGRLRAARVGRSGTSR